MPETTAARVSIGEVIESLMALQRLYKLAELVGINVQDGNGSVSLRVKSAEDLAAWADALNCGPFGRHVSRYPDRAPIHSAWTASLGWHISVTYYEPELPETQADADVLVAETVAALDERKAPAPNALLDATMAALPEPKPGQQYVDFEGDRWQVQTDGTLLWLDTKNIADRQAGLTKPNLLHLAKDWGPLSAGPLVEVVPQPKPAPEVWDGSVPPGGFVCSVCRTPVESEPCELHGEAVLS